MRLILTVVFLLVASTFFDLSNAADIPTDCWNCPSGWAHWWEMGYSQPTNGDKCQCVQGTPRSTTSAPNPTGYDTRGCWTCPSGWTHWFNAGIASAPGGDACACVKTTQTSAPSTPTTTTTRAPTSAPTTTTTKAPTTAPNPTGYDTRGCWTCPSGWTHWFNAGMASAPGGDACACVKTTQTSAPTPTTTTTRAPTSAPTTTTTTRAPATTSSPTGYDTRGCWTCFPDYTHWFNAGMSSPPGGDACACVKITQTLAPTPTTTTTRAPSTPTTTTTTTRAPATTSSPSYDTRGCWTCPAGYTHWFMAGMVSAPGGDACACVAGDAQPTASATSTRAPSSSPTTTTTNSPTTPTTRAPTTPISTPNCWACPTGWAHWYEFGYPASPSSDQCQCIQGVVNPKTKNTPRTPQMTKFINAMTPTGSSPGSVSFSPYVAPYAPWNAPPISLIDQLANGLYKQTGFRTVMIYYLEPYLAGSLVNAGFNILGIIALNTDTAQNTVKIQQAIDTVKKYPNNILALACGNELGMQLGTNGNSAGIINNCISTLRRANLGLPIGVTDTFTSWTQNTGLTQWSAVSDNVDWIGVNYYAWFDNMYIPPPFTCETPENGPLITYQSILRVQALYPNIEVVLTEFGWPACPAGYSCTSPNIHDGSTCTSGSDSSQKTFVQKTVDLFRKYQRPLNTFAAYRESWKAQNSLAIEEFWGVCSGTAPYSCYNAPV